MVTLVVWTFFLTADVSASSSLVNPCLFSLTIVSVAFLFTLFSLEVMILPPRAWRSLLPPWLFFLLLPLADLFPLEVLDLDLDLDLDLEAEDFLVLFFPALFLPEASTSIPPLDWLLFPLEVDLPDLDLFPLETDLWDLDLLLDFELFLLDLDFPEDFLPD